MTTWVWIILAGLTAYATKFAGYLLPKKVLDSGKLAAVSMPLTVGLLAALVTTSTIAEGGAIVADSRLLALVGTLLALRLRAPFIVVVIIGALLTALGRLAGLP